MAEQRIDASLDAFDALIADLAASGDVDRSEVSALAEQREVPRTGGIPIQSAPLRSAWTDRSEAAPAASVPNEVAASAAADASAAELAPAPVHPALGEAKPMTRREARALREAQEALQAASAADTGPIAVAIRAAAENQRRAEEQIRSRSVRPQLLTSVPAPMSATAVARSVSIFSKRRHLTHRTAAAGAAFALLPALLFAAPANAAQLADAALQPHSSAGAAPTAAQILDVADGIQAPTMDQVNYLASELASIVVANGGEDAQSAAPAIASALQLGGARQKIIETALQYLGVPYVLGGAGFSGIDCSGLTMVAYAAAGVTLPHYVPTQDVMGVRISEAQALPGDLVVFDDEDHVGIYLGGNQVIAAPEPGRKVSIESVDLWKPIGIHFTRILPAS